MFQRRIKQLEAAPNLSALDGCPGHCHPLVGDRDGQLAASVGRSNRLIFVPDHDPQPRLPDGGLDRKAVTRIEIWSVENYHG